MNKIIMASTLLLAACASAGERASDECTDAKLLPGTPAYESCVIRRMEQQTSNMTNGLMWGANYWQQQQVVNSLYTPRQTNVTVWPVR